MVTKKKKTVKGLAGSQKSVVTTVQKLEDGLTLSDPLEAAERRRLQAVARSVPVTAIERLIALAARHGGSIAGIAFDAEEARNRLSDAQAADTIASSGRTFVRRLEDDAIRRRGGLADEGMAVILALKGFVRTTEGKALRPDLQEIRALMRRPKKAAAKPAEPTKQPSGTTVSFDKPATMSVAVREAVVPDGAKVTAVS